MINSNHKFDWFVEISQQKISILEEITELEDIIKNSKDKNERKNLSNKRKNIVCTKLFDGITDSSSQIITLSSLYFEYSNESLKKIYINQMQQKPNLSNLSSIFSITCIDIQRLPLFSFFIKFNFSLALPYISKDDEEFYICENPIKKDKVFKIPMISGSSWKGNLRWTAMRIFIDKLPGVIKKGELREKLNERVKLVRLFGYEKDSMEDYLNAILAQKLVEEGYETDNVKNNETMKKDTKTQNEIKIKNNTDVIKREFNNLLLEKGYINPNIEGRRSRLNFFPTFFDDISLEVINPHDRKTKAGTLPIYIESVPEGAKGTFSLLYVPFDLLGKPESKVKSEVAEDLDCVFEALKEMMLTYGFSAKKSSGFGVIKDEFEESLFDINGIDIEEEDKHFKNFLELEEKVKSVKQKLLKEEGKK